MTIMAGANRVIKMSFISINAIHKANILASTTAAINVKMIIRKKNVKMSFKNGI